MITTLIVAWERRRRNYLALLHFVCRTFERNASEKVTRKCERIINCWKRPASSARTTETGIRICHSPIASGTRLAASDILCNLPRQLDSNRNRVG